MVLKIVGAVVLVIAIFLILVSTKDGRFNYSRSGTIAASPETIYPYLSQFKLGKMWSPYEKMDPNMKETYGGTEGQVGSYMEWEGTKAGSGRIEITSLIPNQRVELLLHMTKPMEARNHVVYQLEPVQGGTRFTWSMDGDGGFMGKLVSTFINCEKMIGDQFNSGITNLKQVVENTPPMNLTETPTIVEWPKTHYEYVEKIGPFQETAHAAWTELNAQKSKIPGVKGAMALYRMNPQMVYRAGFIVDQVPKDLPTGFKSVTFAGGKYSKFTYVGPYSNLGPVSGKVFEAVKTLNIQQRDDFNIEHYVNDPSTTPEKDLVTEILIPTK